MRAQRHVDTIARTAVAKLLGASLLALVVAGPAATAASRQVRPEYARPDDQRKPTPQMQQRAPLPSALRIASPDGASEQRDEVAPARRTARRSPAGTEPATELERRARSAGRSEAEAVVRTAGRREYLRVGFWEGLRDALAASWLGEWDYREGERLGARDVEAGIVGGEAGAAAAALTAERAAAERVSEQFSNLAERPVLRPGAPRPMFSGALPDVPEPTLEELFVEFPLRRFGGLDRDVRAWLVDWGWGPSRLHRCEAWDEFHDGAWRESDHAFTAWRASRSASAYYRGLTSGVDRSAFRSAFREAFDQRVAELYAGELLPAFDDGLDRGWHYGAFVRREWDYRRGYRDGFLHTVELSARATFFGAYPALYERAYREQFDDWSHNPKPQIDDARLIDGNGDGVFEPGEELRVAVRLVNYGGGGARMPLELDGPELIAPARVTFDLAPRAETGDDGRLQARIRPGTPPKTETRVALQLGDSLRQVPLRVAYPLELRPGAWRVERRNLAGEVVLTVALENQSLRAVDGRLQVAASTLAGAVVDRPTGLVPPGRTRSVAVEIGGLDPLDLLAGTVRLDVELVRQSDVQDRAGIALPGAAADLDNRDLLVYMVQLAREGTRAQERIAATRDLLLGRLREDWRAAVADSGNPYKRDLRRRDSATALGDLVWTCRAQEPAVRSHPVFVGLSDDVLGLARDLPGVHPFLRKYLRKLARQLP